MRMKNYRIMKKVEWVEWVITEVEWVIIAKVEWVINEVEWVINVA